MDRRKEFMPKKSPSGSSGASSSEYSVNVPCFPTPIFSSQSHLRHVLPQIPTRADHPRMAVSKASTRDPFLGRMSEGELFADVITTHRLDDLEQAHVVTKELHGDSKFCDSSKPENHRSAAGVNTSVDFTSLGDMKGRKPALWEEDADRESVTLTRSTSPSSMLNIGETTKKRSAVHKSYGSSDFAKLGRKESKGFSGVMDDSDTGCVVSNSKSSKQSKLSDVIDSGLHPRSRYATKHRNPGKSSLFPMFDEDDTDDDNASSDSSVAMNLSLASKSSLQSSSNVESLPEFPAPQCQTVKRGTGNFGRSPLDAIMKMTSRINTSKKEPPPSTTNTDAAIAVDSLKQDLSAACNPFQSRGDAWSQDARIFGSDSLPGMSYGKIAAEGMLKLPVETEASDAFDDVQAASASEFVVRSSASRTTDVPGVSSTQLQSAKQTSSGTSGEVYEDPTNIPISDGKPIKLKIRRGVTGGNSQLSVVMSKQLHDTKADDVVVKSGEAAASNHPSPLALSLLGATPSPGPAPTGAAKSKLPAPGRAKTKGELKKQLFERKEQRLRNDGSQASSPAGSTMTPSPSRSHADTLSPLSVNVDAGPSTPQPSPQLSSGKTSAATVISPTENTAGVRCDVNAVKWKLGDMLWAKVSGHPWWPCIVLPDPDQSVWTKPFQRRQNAVQLQYHVRFYGEQNERGWVPESSLIQFRGRQAFDDYAEQMVAEHRRERKSFTISASRKRAWDVAVSAAETARMFPRRQRVERWMPVSDLQIPDDGDGSSEQGPSEDSNCIGRYRHSPKGRKTKTGGERTDVGMSSKTDHIKLPKSISNQRNAQFAVFCQKRRVSLRSENPQMSDEEIDSVLMNQWRHLDAKTRARYIPMGSDVIHLSDVIVSPTAKTEEIQKASKKSPKVASTQQTKRDVAHVDGECGAVERRRTRSESINEDVLQSRREMRSRTLSTDKSLHNGSPKAEEKERIVQRRSSRETRNKSSTKSADIETLPSTDNVVTTHRRESKDVSQTEENVAVAFPPKKRRRKSVAFDDSSVTVTPVEMDQVNSVAPVDMDQVKPAAVSDKGDSDGGEEDEDEDDDDSSTDSDVADTCRVCDKLVTSAADTVRCTSHCNGVFHRACVNQPATVTTETFKCSECKQKCFVCKVVDSESTVSCSEPSCGQLYHVTCVGKLLPLDEVVDKPKFVCPLHRCATCQAIGKTVFADGDCDVYFQCVRCPTAYHADSQQKCVAAGSQSVTGLNIVCPRHFEPVKSNTHHSRIHTSWCCICQHGDELVGCELCPVSYHVKCLPSSSNHRLCPLCSQGRPCLYGDMVWVKFGSYRWWPGEICFPEDIPDNILERPHYVGEFVVCFYGSRDYLWTHRGRVFPFSDKDKCCRDFTSSSKSTPKDFIAAIDEAVALFKKRKPSDRDTTQCRLPSLYAAEAVSMPSDEPSAFEFTPFMPQATEEPVDWIPERCPDVVNNADSTGQAEDGPTCFHCGCPGRLVLCDRVKCGRMYHLTCTGVRRLPHGVWLCPSHHCDECGRTAVMSCDFCPTAFCSEHCHNNIRLTEYYQLACLKHSDVVLCEDPNILKTFGLCKTTKASSSRKQQTKPSRRKSSSGVKRTSRGDGEDAEISSEGHAVCSKKHRQKTGTPVVEPREHIPKRSCRERDVKKSEVDLSVPLAADLSARLGERENEMKRLGKKKERQQDKRHRSHEFEGGQRRSHGSKEDDKTVHSRPSRSLEGLQKGMESSKTSVLDRHCHQGHKQVVESSKKSKKSTEALAHEGSRRRSHEQAMDHQVRKRRRIQDSASSDESMTASLNFFSSAAVDASSPLRSSALPGTAVAGVKSTVKSAANASEKALVDDEPLFDNSDDEFPDLVIDVPTI